MTLCRYYGIVNKIFTAKEILYGQLDLLLKMLTHRGRVTHIHFSKLDQYKSLYKVACLCVSASSRLNDDGISPSCKYICWLHCRVVSRWPPNTMQVVHPSQRESVAKSKTHQRSSLLSNLNLIYRVYMVKCLITFSKTMVITIPCWWKHTTHHRIIFAT